MSLITKPNELKNDAPISCLIYGQPGAGKTSLAISSEKPLLIDIDRGLHRVHIKNRCPSVQVSKYEDVLDVLDSPELSEFKTIVIDTMGKLIDIMGIYLAKMNPKYKKADGGFSPNGWGAIKTQAHDLIQKIFSKNKNVIFVAHEREDKDGDDKIVRPDIPGSAGKDLLQDLDLMGYVQMVGNRRTISFSPTQKFYAKNSLNLPAVIEIPDNSIRNDFYETQIIKAVEKERAEANELKSDYDKLIDKYKSNIDAINSIEDLNIAFKAMKEDSPLWDSMIVWKRALKDKADSMKAIFNTSKGEFENVINNA